MTNIETQELINAVMSNGDPLWALRTTSLLEAMDGTDIDLASETLLDDVIAAADAHPKIMQFLVNLPGYPDDAAEAIKQLEYLAGMARSALTELGVGHG